VNDLGFEDLLNWGAELGRDFDEPGLIAFDRTEGFIAAIKDMQ
jgi:hypothetical protein